MQKLKTKIGYLLIITAVIMSCMMSVSEVNASSEVKVNYIVSKRTVKMGEEFVLTVNLEDFYGLSSALFVCKYNEALIKPQRVNDKYYNLSPDAIFLSNDVVTNDCIDGTLRFFAITKNALSVESTKFRSLLRIKFLANSDINNTITLFEPLRTREYGCNIVLSAENLDAMNYTINYSEEIKVDWNVDKYEVDVYGKLPNFALDITVTNRHARDYTLEILQEEININKIGSQIVKARIYDNTNAHITYLAKVVEVIDKVAPVIKTSSTEVSISSNEITNNDFIYATISDNYDETPTLINRYYTFDNIECNNLAAFQNYLAHNYQGYIIYQGNDSSNNQANTLRINIEVRDEQSPSINDVEDIVVDYERIEQIKLEEQIKVTDEYDSAPKLIMRVYDEDGIIHANYLELLKETGYARVEYYGIDKSSNKSATYHTIIMVNDTVAPIITGVTAIDVTDSDALKIKTGQKQLSDNVKIVDNYPKGVSLTTKYYLEEQETSSEIFWTTLLKGTPGKVEFTAVDKAGNTSNIFLQTLTIIDTTPPSVIVKNIEENRKYFELTGIDYEVSDNISKDVTIQIYLNDKEYDYTPIKAVGKYQLKLMVADESHNESVTVINFEIIKNNIIGCADDVECYTRNYTDVIIVIGIIMVVILVIIGINIWNAYQKKHPKKTEVVLEEEKEETIV